LFKIKKYDVHKPPCTGTGAVEDRTGGDADSAEDLTAADNTDEGCTSSGDGRDGRATDEARLLERGVELHALSADEEEGDDSEEEMDGRDLTPEEAAAATAVLDANDDDQEGLVLTGGDWFNTIKQVAKTNKEAEKELAARMKKAKISQTSLENEVFEGEPSDQSSADAGPGVQRKDPPPFQSPDPPPTLSKKMDPDSIREQSQGWKPAVEPEPDPGADPALDWDPAPDPSSDPESGPEADSDLKLDPDPVSTSGKK
jgi:hypothetical protein